MARATKKPAEHFEDILGCSDVPIPEREITFSEDRKWRFDYAWPDKRIAVEIQGGRYHRGNMAKDYEKLNEAVRLGWRVIQFDSTMLASEVKRISVCEYLESILKGVGNEGL